MAENVWRDLKSLFCALGDGFEPLDVRRIGQGDAQLGFHPGVRDLLALGVKASGHRRQARIGRVGGRRAGQPQQLGTVGDDVLGCGGKIVRHVKDVVARADIQGRVDGGRNVIDVDAIGDLSRLEDTPCGAGAELINGASSGP